MLNRPVKNIAQHCLDMDITMMGTPRPLQCLLAELCSLPVVHYHIHLIGWLWQNISKLLFVHKWCADRAQTFLMYIQHLESGGCVDGLEVLLVSVTMDININVAQDDVVWASSRDGICFTDPIIVWTMVGALPCKYCDPDNGNLGDVDTSRTTDSADANSTPHLVSEPEPLVLGALLHRPKGGRPLVSIPEHCDALSSDTTDTNPDDQLCVDLSLKKRLKNPNSGCLSPQAWRSVGLN